MSTLKRSTPISLTIRKKSADAISKIKNLKVPVKYYDPIYRIGENIVVRIGGDDRLGNLFEGDALVTNEKDVPTGHINMVYHIVKNLDLSRYSAVSPFYFFGALQTSLPKLNAIIQANPVQNKETAPAQKTSMVLTDVHADDVATKYAIREKLYAVPEIAPAEYAALGTTYRFTVCNEKTFENIMRDAVTTRTTAAPATPTTPALAVNTGVPANAMDTLKAQYYVGRAHNGKAVGYGNVYYTLA
jgi:hypothetical protein